MILALALCDLLAAVVMLSLMTAITNNFGWSTSQQRWALFRRITYALVAFAFFTKGVYNLDHMSDPFDWRDEGSQLIVVGYVIVFPLLRAMGLVSQDKWL